MVSLLLLAIATALLLHAFTAYLGQQSSLYVAVGVPSDVGSVHRAAVLMNGDNGHQEVADHDELHDSSKCSCSRKRGYVLSLRYSGQQGSGIGALLSQLCWIESFDLPMKVVEPYVRSSSLVGLPALNSSQDLKISDYFDFDHLVHSALDRGYGLLATVEEFERVAPRDLILVLMVGGKIADYAVNVVWESNPESTVCMTNISHKMDHFERNGFCVVKVIKIIFGFGTTFVFTAEDMYKIFGRWKPEDITLVFSLWRAPWFVQNVELVNPAMCDKSASRGLQSILRPSKRLLEDSRKYEELFLQVENRLSVMMRVEHSVWQLGRAEARATRRNKTSTINISQCFHKLQNITHTLQKKLGYNGIFLTADVGKYASSTWNQTLKHFHYTKSDVSMLFTLVESYIGLLLSNKVTFQQWQESFSKVLMGGGDAGYIAALQRTIASRSDCLVLLGGGLFQRLALHEYVRNHPDLKMQCVYFVCLDDAFAQDFNEITGGKAVTLSL